MPHWLQLMIESLGPLLWAALVFTAPLTLLSFAFGLIVGLVVALIRLFGPKLRVLQALDALIEACQDDDCLDPVLAERSLQLVLGIDRIERGDDRPELPGAKFGDEELRAVGK